MKIIKLTILLILIALNIVISFWELLIPNMRVIGIVGFIFGFYILFLVRNLILKKSKIPYGYYMLSLLIIIIQTFFVYNQLDGIFIY